MAQIQEPGRGARMDYLDHHNENPKPFIWTAAASPQAAALAFAPSAPNIPSPSLPQLSRGPTMPQATKKRPAAPAVTLTKLLINNEWVDPLDGGSFETYNPAT